METYTTISVITYSHFSVLVFERVGLFRRSQEKIVFWSWKVHPDAPKNQMHTHT